MRSTALPGCLRDVADAADSEKRDGSEDDGDREDDQIREEDGIAVHFKPPFLAATFYCRSGLGAIALN